jgi:hypothetical protein
MECGGGGGGGGGGDRSGSRFHKASCIATKCVGVCVDGPCVCGHGERGCGGRGLGASSTSPVVSTLPLPALSPKNPTPKSHSQTHTHTRHKPHTRPKTDSQTHTHTRRKPHTCTCTHPVPCSLPMLCRALAFAVHGLVGSVHKSAYVASKHGIVGFTKVVRAQLHARCPWRSPETQGAPWH